jgi:hypothetical protein
MRLIARIGFAALACAGCAAQHVYIPAQHATATLPDTGTPAALYSVPPGLPRGEVTVGALGTRKVADSHQHELGVRMIVKNNSDQPWRVDVRQQRIAMPDGSQLAPGYVLGVPENNPLLDIAPRGEANIDLIYAVGDAKPATFQLLWSVATPGEYVTQRTDFRRETVEPAYAYGPPLYDGYFYAPFYYSYPSYPYVGFGSTIVTRGPYIAPRIHYGRRPTYIVPARPPIHSVRPGR